MAFWCLYFIDPNLVWPKFVESVVPQWQNHIMHTLPLVTSIIDNFIANRQNSSFWKGILTTAFFAILYIIWYFFDYIIFLKFILYKFIIFS
jgi:hypothetical protein